MDQKKKIISGLIEGGGPLPLVPLTNEDQDVNISSPSSGSIASNIPLASRQFLGKRKQPNNGSSLSLPTDINYASSTNNLSRRGSATSGSVTLEVQEESSQSSDESYCNDNNTTKIPVSSYAKNIKRKSECPPFLQRNISEVV